MLKGIALGATITAVLLCSVAASAFGFEPRELTFTATESPGIAVEESEPGQLGSVDTRAGSHPFVLTTSLRFATRENPRGEVIPDGDVKDIEAALPAGLVGNANAMPQCSIADFHTPDPELMYLFPSAEIPTTFSGAGCPDNTQVGWVDIEVEPTGHQPPLPLALGIYNLVPPPGVPAEFGFNPIGLAVTLTPQVRTGGDYGLSVGSRETSQLLRIFGVKLSFWGVPADSRHDILRGKCLGTFGESLCTTRARTEEAAAGLPQFTPVSAGLRPVGFLSLPTSCSGNPLSMTLTADSWQEPGARDGEGNPILTDPRWKSETTTMPPMTGCDQPFFAPELQVGLDTSRADTPAGFSTDVKVHQEGLLDPAGVASASLLNTTVLLPEGLTINPGQASGLQACQTAESGLGREAPAQCPLGSKVGTAQITTPLLPDKLEGNVYVLQSNPPHLKLLVAASADGVNLKLEGEVHLDEKTGRLTAVFANTPQLPFTDFNLSFSGGPQAALTTPATCGTYSTTADFTPWTSPIEQDVLSNGTFAIESGPNGSPCASPLPFGPEMIAGSTTDQSGAFTNFSLLLTRPDGQQRVSTLQFKTPGGLLGIIGKVPLCGEPQAALGQCSAASQIGHTVIEAGPGPDPLVVPQPGQPAAPIYLTGPYGGAPYGLSIAVPVIAGPFNLGTEVVRSKIEVDPHTGQLTITTDPLPQIIDGVPTDLRAINAVIDRPGFMFNPTNCTSTSFSGSASSLRGATAPLASHFQVGSCQSQRFKPSFKVSTAGKTSKSKGASLHVTLTANEGPQSDPTKTGEANIKRVDVQLPKVLPSRLTTLQLACTAAQFEANPSGCPAASFVGSVLARTPVLASPLTGPAILVSHGGAAFPDLVVVLQGGGVVLDLTGHTSISHGITSSKFDSVPDAPISSFALSLPQGAHSVLASSVGNLCGRSLTMPTTMEGQNGAVLKQSTKIAVTGCKAPRHRARPARRSRRRS